MIGGVACLILLTVTGGKIRMLMIVSTILMTLGTGLMALARPDNIGPVIVILIVAGLGIGGILVPASIITTIICPDDLIATVSALTLSIRVLGGAVGYAVSTLFDLDIMNQRTNVVARCTTTCSSTSSLTWQ
jgi:MFS family permease